MGRKPIGPDDMVNVQIYASKGQVRAVDAYCKAIGLNRSEYTRGLWAKDMEGKSTSAATVDLAVLEKQLDALVRKADHQRFHLQKVKVYEPLSHIAEDLKLDTETFSNAAEIVAQLWNYRIRKDDDFNRGHVKLMISLIETRKSSYDLEQRILKEQKR